LSEDVLSIVLGRKDTEEAARILEIYLQAVKLGLSTMKLLKRIACLRYVSKKISPFAE